MIVGLGLSLLSWILVVFGFCFWVASFDFGFGVWLGLVVCDFVSGLLCCGYCFALSILFLVICMSLI